MTTPESAPPVEDGSTPAGALAPTPQAEPYIRTADRDTFISMFHGGGQPFTADGRLAAGKGVDVAHAALSYVGAPFAWGGNGYGGVDPASLVRAAYGAIGVDLPRLSAEQARAGERIPLQELQPGDLVAWNAYARNESQAPHAAIYVGGGHIVEAPGPGLNVRFRPLDEDDLNAYGVRPMDPARHRRPPTPRER